MGRNREGSSSTVGAMAKRQPFFSQSQRQQGRFEAQTEGQAPPKTGVPPPPPEEVVFAARARVAKLRAVLETLGKDDEMYDTLKASLRKAEMKAQEPPLSEQIRASRAFIGRKLKRVEARGRPATRPEQPSRKLLQRKKNKNDSSPMESADWKNSCSKSARRHRHSQFHLFPSFQMFRRKLPGCRESWTDCRKNWR